ncbi:MAG: N-acetylglucosamine-6-phosphate deacetylase [Candidatus Korobacteraceae bacterium]
MSHSRYGITASVLVSSGRAVFLPLVIIEDGRIAAVQSREHAETPRNLTVTDFPEGILAPGLVDIHIHGGGGHDVMEASDDALFRIERYLVGTGVTSYLPTTVTAPMESTLASLARLGDNIERASRGHAELRAQPLGVHLEGPFISHAKCGVHPLEHIQPPSIELFDRMWQAARGQIGMMTVAPELPGAIDLIQAAAKRNVCVSMGHSDSAREPVQLAVIRGARHATHTFNAMRPLDHREPGILGSVLSDSGITADIIADGIHVHPDVVRLFLQAKGPENAVLITDAISAAGMGDGSYRLGSLEVQVEGARCLHKGKLAGSVLRLDHAILNVMKFADWGIHKAVQLATLNPARVVGVATRQENGTTIPWKGVLESGADADIVVLAGAPQGTGLQAIKTIVRGVGI